MNEYYLLASVNRLEETLDDAWELRYGPCRSIFDDFGFDYSTPNFTVLDFEQ
mgnify:FL=1